ncbi:hypothetical protein RFI_20253, partial [Reticulomyxa filosa]
MTRQSSHGSGNDTGSTMTTTTTTTTTTAAEMHRKKTSRQVLQSTKAQTDWINVLKEQLSLSRPNSKVVKDACKHIDISTLKQMRSSIWKILLNVPNRKVQMENECVNYRKEMEAEDKTSQKKHGKAKATNKQASNYSLASEPLSHGAGTGNAMLASASAPVLSIGSNEESGVEDSSGNESTKPTHKLEANIILHPLRSNPPPLYNQRVIQADVERTRPLLKCFQDATVRREMEIILTEYCHRYHVSYKQGMNYILAPFFMVGMSQRDEIFLCFRAFMEQYLHSTFNDEEFGSLQCIFRLFRLLGQYHDPSLSVFLDQYEIVPE